MKQFPRLLAASYLSVASTMAAPTVLNVGDIFITGYRSAAPDAFSFVTWVDLQPGTSIGFTDGSYLSGGNWNGSENFATWTTPAFIPAGTVIAALDSGTTNQTFDQGAALGGVLDGISAAGDQIFVYQLSSGTVTGATPFNSVSATAAQFNAGHSLVYGLNVANAGFITTGTGNANLSYLPDFASGVGALTGTTSFALNLGSADYTGPRTGLTTGQYKAALLNAANWTLLTGSTALPSSVDFTIIPEPLTTLQLTAGGWVLLALRRRRT